ncbi:hypothetical protein LMG19083_04850 [Ralstonia psammae]|uniref:Uncharacterized protein n=1 Tax=Ralstonia psammae TaxID=3058598 RepID=A0ABN9JHD4_9RALS|nr:hypothetical protein LMG19083_04850 [Ralstonia sp. LMG 19083]
MCNRLPISQAMPACCRISSMYIESIHRWETTTHRYACRVFFSFVPLLSLHELAVQLADSARHSRAQHASCTLESFAFPDVPKPNGMRKRRSHWVGTESLKTHRRPSRSCASLGQWPNLCLTRQARCPRLHLNSGARSLSSIQSSVTVLSIQQPHHPPRTRTARRASDAQIDCHGTPATMFRLTSPSILSIPGVALAPSTRRPLPEQLPDVRVHQ